MIPEIEILSEPTYDLTITDSTAELSCKTMWIIAQKEAWQVTQAQKASNLLNPAYPQIAQLAKILASKIETSIKGEDLVTVGLSETEIDVLLNCLCVRLEMSNLAPTYEWAGSEEVLEALKDLHGASVRAGNIPRTRFFNLVFDKFN